MKNILRIIALLIVVTFVSSCDESNWQESELDMVPIYSITNMVGAEAFYALEIYSNQDLVIEFEKETSLENFMVSDFDNTSTNDVYKLHYTLNRSALTANQSDTTLVRYYEFNGTKLDSVGTYAFFEITGTNDTIKVAEGSMKMFEDQRLY